MTVTGADRLLRRSVEVLRQGQSPSGAFVASPTFPVYRYAWLRDGAFCAHALDAVGDHDASAAFHDWVATSVEGHRPLIETAIARISAGEIPPPEAMPPARYTLDGSLEHTEGEPWPNFQVDGYGMWLWALAEHLNGGGMTAERAATVELVARYLHAAWPLRSFSCWEELDGGEHTSTLAAVAAGLAAAARLIDDSESQEAADQVRATLLERCIHDGRLGRGPHDPRLDGSLLWIAVPFRVFAPDDPLVVATVAAIRQELVGPGGGVYRYLGDGYYGGGQWLLLTCSLGWHDAVTGEWDELERARAWVRGCARANGDLPEQVTDHAQRPDMVEPWVRRWGPVATPLLWSHAMYLIMEAAAAERR